MEFLIVLIPIIERQFNGEVMDLSQKPALLGVLFLALDGFLFFFHATTTHDFLAQTEVQGLLDCKEEAHLPKAINENYYAGAFPSKLQAYNKKKKYLVYCQSGGRGKNVLKLMIQEGFQEAYHLKGGFDAWKAQGLPITSKTP